MTTTVFNVAHHILTYDDKDHDKDHDKDFNLLQLIKLCYLSYGWYLALYDKRLFSERIEAWKYGPVIPELYYALKHFRGGVLPTDCLGKLVIKDDSSLSDDALKVINAVVGFYGQYSGTELSTLTHKKGSPWKKTYKGIGKPWVSISDEVIKNHFDKLNRKNN